MNAVTIESNRLLLKKLSMEHLSQEYVNWLNDPMVYKFMVTRGNYSLEKLQNFLSEQSKKDILFWAIHIKDTNKHIGNIKIDPVSVDLSGEYGIMIGDRSSWGNGYAKEASKMVIQFCFDRLKFSAITLGVVEENATAIKLYEGLGFTIKEKKQVLGYGKEGFSSELRMALTNEKFIK